LLDEGTFTSPLPRIRETSIAHGNRLVPNKGNDHRPETSGLKRADCIMTTDDTHALPVDGPTKKSRMRLGEYPIGWPTCQPGYAPDPNSRRPIVGLHREVSFIALPSLAHLRMRGPFRHSWSTNGPSFISNLHLHNAMSIASNSLRCHVTLDQQIVRISTA